MIWWNGVASDDVGVIVEHYPDRPIARRKMESYSVPGRSGDIIRYQDAWENVVRKYDIYISAERQKLPRALRRVTEWLNQPGYCRLEDSYDPDVYMIGYFQGGMDIENILNRFGRATIEFNCKPQRFLKSGEHSTRLSTITDLVNPTGMPAKPLIEYTLNSSGQYPYLEFRFGTPPQSILRIGSPSSGSGHVVIDCEAQNVTLDGENYNDSVTGTFPVLGAGITSISVTGHSTVGRVIIPRWWSL